MENNSNSSFTPPKTSSARSVLLLRDVSSPHIVTQLTCGLRSLYSDSDDESSHSSLSQNEARHFTRPNGEFWAEPGMMLANRYRIRSHSKTSSQSAVVLEAQDCFQRMLPVKIKITHRSYLAVGLKEVDTLRRLNTADPGNNSHTIRLLNTFMMQEHVCLVFPVLNSMSVTRIMMAKRLDEEPDWRTIKKITIRLLTALAFLRCQNTIHADIKPDNILLNKSCDPDTATLIDFGNAIHHTHEEVSLYYTDFELQTLPYRAPEVHLGIPFGVEVDMWSLGCVLAELYTGSPLFSGLNRVDTLKKMTAILGPLPADMCMRGKYHSEAETAKLTSKTFPRNKTENGVTNAQRLMDGLPGLRNYQFASFLSSLLVYHPDKRLTPWEALQHQFLASEICIPYFLSGEVADPHIIKKDDYGFTQNISSTVRRLCPSTFDLLRHGTVDRLLPEDICRNRVEPSHQQAGKQTTIAHGSSDIVPYVRENANYHLCSGRHTVPSPCRDRVMATTKERFNPEIVEKSPKVESLPFIKHPVKVMKLSDKTFDVHPFVMAQDDEKSHSDGGVSSLDIKIENSSGLHSEGFNSWPVQDCQDKAHKAPDSISSSSHDRTKCYPCMPSCSRPRKRLKNNLTIETKSSCQANLLKPMSEMKEENLLIAELKDSHDIVKTFTDEEGLMNVSTDTYVVKHHSPSLDLNLSTATYTVHSTHRLGGKAVFPSLSPCGSKKSVNSSTKGMRYNRHKTETVIGHHSPCIVSSLNHCQKQSASNSHNLQSLVSPGSTCRRQHILCCHEDSLVKDSPNFIQTPHVALNRVEHSACDVPAKISLGTGNDKYMTGGYKLPRHTYYAGGKNWTESNNPDFRGEENDACKNTSLHSRQSESLSENEIKVRQLHDKRKYLQPKEGCNNDDRKFVTTKPSLPPGRYPRMMTSRQSTHRTHKFGNLSHSSHGSTVDGIQPDSHLPDLIDIDSALISSDRGAARGAYTMTVGTRHNSGEDAVLEVHSHSHSEEEDNSFSEEDNSALNTTFIVEHPSVELVTDEKLGFLSPQMKCKSKSACSEEEYVEEIDSTPLQINFDNSDIDYASVHSNSTNYDEECVGFNDEDIDSEPKDKLLVQESTSKMEQDVLLNTESNGFQTSQILLGSRIEKQVITSQESAETCQNIGTGNSGHSVSYRLETMISSKENMKRVLDNTEPLDQVKDEMVDKDDFLDSGFKTCKDRKSKKMEPCSLKTNADPKNVMKDSLGQEEDERMKSAGSSAAEDESSSQQEHKVRATQANNTQISGRKRLQCKRTRKRRMKSDLASFTVRSKRMQKRTAKSKLISYTTERVSTLYTNKFMYEGSSKIKDGKTPHLKQLAVRKSRIPSKSVVSRKKMKVISAKLQQDRKKRAKKTATEDKSYETITSCNADSGISTSGQDFDDTDKRIGCEVVNAHKKCKTIVAGIIKRKTRIKESPPYSQKHLDNKHVSPNNISGIKDDDPNTGNKTRTRVSNNVTCPVLETNATVSSSPKVTNEVANDAIPVISDNFNMCITGKDIHRNLLAYQPATVERRPNLKTCSSSAGRLSRARAVKRALNFQTHTTLVTDMHTPVGRPRQVTVSKLTPSSVQNFHVSQTRLKITSTPTASNLKRVKKRLLQSFTSSPNKSQNSDPYEFKVTPRKTTTSLSNPRKVRSAKSVQKPASRSRKTSQRGRKKICSVDNSYPPSNINIGDLVVQKSEQLFLGLNKSCDKCLLGQSSGRQETKIASLTQGSVCPVEQKLHPCEDYFIYASGRHPSRKSGTERQSFLHLHEQPVEKWPENFEFKSQASNSTQLSCSPNEVKDSIITSIGHCEVAVLQSKSSLGKNHQPQVESHNRHKPEAVASAEQVIKGCLLKRRDCGGSEGDWRITMPVKKKRLIPDETSQVAFSLPTSESIYDEPTEVNNLEEEILLLD